MSQHSQCGGQCLSHRGPLINVCWPKLNMFLLNDWVTFHELPFFLSPGHIFISSFPCQNPKDCFTVLYNLSVRSLTHKTHVIIPLWGLALSFNPAFQFIRPCTGKPGRQGLEGFPKGVRLLLDIKVILSSSGSLSYSVPADCIPSSSLVNVGRPWHGTSNLLFT